MAKNMKTCKFGTLKRYRIYGAEDKRMIMFAVRIQFMCLNNAEGAAATNDKGGGNVMTLWRPAERQ